MMPKQPKPGKPPRIRDAAAPCLFGWLVLAAPTPATVAQQDTQGDPADRVSLPNANDVTEVGDLADLELLDLEIPVVVTATRREQRLSRVPHAMSVITAGDIRRMGARSVPDALRLVPGMDVAELSYGNAAVSPRAHHSFISREVLVLVDGRQIYDSLFGGTLWGCWPFQLEDIERIEVIRGPGGVTWGANAMNGVINIITKDPADQQGLTITSRGASRGTFKQHVGYAWNEGDLRMRLSGEYEASDGFQKGGSIIRNLEDDYKTGRVGLHGIREDKSGGMFTFSIGSSVKDGGFSPTPLGGIGAVRNAGSQASFIMGRWSRRTARDARVELTAYVNDFHASPGLSAIDYRYQQIGLQISHAMVPAESHLLTWGMDSRTDLLDTTNSDPFLSTRGFVSTAIVGIYLQDEWHFRPKWSINAGARIDYEFYGGFQPSARVALAFEPDDRTMVYGAVSRAFQISPAGFWFLDIPLMNGLSRVVVHRGVDPERVLAYELGIRKKPSASLDTSVHLFWHEYADLTPIKMMLAPPGLLRLDVDNRADSSAYGLEYEVQWKASEETTLRGTYTYQRSDWRSDTPYFLTDAMSEPRHKFMLAAYHDVTPDVRLSSHLFFVNDVKSPTPSFPFVATKTDRYLRLDVLADFDLSDDRASITVGVKNLLDPHHSEGRTLFLNDAEVPRMAFIEYRRTLAHRRALE